MDMFQVSVRGKQATISVHGRDIRFPIEPPPAARQAPGYTRTAWIWCALSQSLEEAGLTISDRDLRAAAIAITKKMQV
jgi:hypothetical protein